MIIDCLSIRDNLIENLSIPEGLTGAFIQVGNREDSNAYIAGKKALCEKKNVNAAHHKFPEDITQEDLISFIHELNSCDAIHGIMVQLPLPNHIDEEAVINAIKPEKDIDGFTHINKGKLLVGDPTAILPCTPYGIMEILKSIEFDCKGKNVVVAGRSNIVGKPMVQLLINNGATVTCCNSKTDPETFKNLVFNSDLFISAIDKPCYYNVEYFGKDNLSKLKDTIAIDVGIFRVNGKLEGNINKDLYNSFKAITPVPKGVGPMTVAGVLSNIKKCYDIQHK